jgi:two-component system, sensor histidine kinase and response regulator
LNNPPRVIVVDDEPTLRELVVAQLNPTGYELLVYPSAVAALEDLQALETADLILMDVMMPDVDGFTACERIRALTPRFLPILLVTALGETVHKVRGLDAGADDFITKPTNASELRARVRAHLRAKQLHDELEQAHAELTRLSAYRDNLVSMIVHDLRNPLGSVSMALQMMGTPPDVSLIDDITWQLTRNQVEFALDLCEQLLNIRQIERGQMEVTITNTPIHQTIMEAFEPLRLSAELRDLAVDLQLAEFNWNTDHRLLKRVVMNLMSNAVKYSPSGEGIGLRLKHADGLALIEVSDRGPGIPPEYHAKIFELFGTAEGVKGVPKVGIGLAFARQALELLGGRIEVLSRPGEGCTFIVQLPEIPG